MLHATETGISSRRLALWLVCAFTYLTYLSPRGKNLTQYFCLAYDNEIPPISQNGKKSEISFNKVTGTKIGKVMTKMHRSLYRQEKDATSSARSQKAPRNTIHLLSVTCQSWPNVPTEQLPHVLWRASCFEAKYRSLTRIYRKRCRVERDRILLAR